MIKEQQSNKPILDVCCGGKMFYFDKNNPDVTFMDIRNIETTLCDGRKFEVRPDIVADFTNIPFPEVKYKNGKFLCICFDLYSLNSTTRVVGNIYENPEFLKGENE